jgi:hypothetical protein
MPSRLALLLSTALLLLALSGLQTAGRFLPPALAQSSGQRVAQNPTEAPPANACGPTNIACHCSFQCCGEERCDGSICNQCVIDCVQRQQAVDKRSTALRARCQSLMTRGFKRL